MTQRAMIVALLVGCSGKTSPEAELPDDDDPITTTSSDDDDDITVIIPGDDDDDDDDTTTPTTTDATTPSASCSFTLFSTAPENLARDIYIGDLWDTVAIEASEPLDLRLWDADNAAWVDGTTGIDEDDGSSTWTPSEPLAPNTTFQVRATGADGCTVVATQFTSVDWTEPDPADLVGNLYALRIDALQFFDEHYTLGLLSPAVGTWYEVPLVVDPTYQADDLLQDTCAPTVPIASVTISGAEVHLSGVFSELRGAFGYVNGRTELLDADIHMLHTAQGLTRPLVVGEIDVTAFIEEEYIVPTEDWCDLLATIGMLCVPCSDRPLNQCVAFEGDDGYVNASSESATVISQAEADTCAP